MNTKKILKNIKLHEQQISMFFGIIILIVASIFLISYVKNLRNQQNSLQKETVTQNQNITHTVTKGESLWTISKLYYKEGNNWKKIANANNISNPKKLEIGTKLIIPDTNTISTATPKPQITEKAASTTADIKEASYTVVKGDNLWKIAIRAYGDGYKWVEIAHANKLLNPNLIHPGNVFILPR
jgi:nucleoid-associated protein YgaU